MVKKYFGEIILVETFWGNILVNTPRTTYSGSTNPDTWPSLTLPLHPMATRGKTLVETFWGKPHVPHTWVNCGNILLKIFRLRNSVGNTLVERVDCLKQGGLGSSSTPHRSSLYSRIPRNVNLNTVVPYGKSLVDNFWWSWSWSPTGAAYILVSLEMST